MKTRSEFARELAKLDLSHADRAVTFLWYYLKSNDYEERTASELANDLHDEGFPKPNVTRLQEELKRSVNTIKGKRKGTFQLDVRRIKEFDDKYSEILGFQTVIVDDIVLPMEWGKSRRYLERLIAQINGTYKFGYIDACAVLCRRLMESLIIEVYISEQRENEIKNPDNRFRALEALINKITSDGTLNLTRNNDRIMNDIKNLGDTAAHDRVYITPPIDIDDLKSRYRKLIHELLSKAKIL